MTQGDGLSSSEMRTLEAARRKGPVALQVAADAITRRRLDRGLSEDPRLGQMLALGRRACEGTLQSIARYPQSGARGEQGLFTELHRNAVELSCAALAMHLLRPSEEALKGLGRVFVKSGAGLSKWIPRPVLDLPPGTGKTESAKALMIQSIEMHRAGELPGPYPGVLFLANEVVQLEAVAEDLEARGLVFGQDFGVFHTRPGGQKVKISDCPSLPIVLATVQQVQARVKKMRRGLVEMDGIGPLVTMEGDRKRSLIIKDEQMLGVDTHYFSPESLRIADALLRLGGKVKNEPAFDSLREFVAQVLALIDEALISDMRAGEVRTVQMPPMDEELAAIAEQAASVLVDERSAHEVLMSLSIMGSVSDLGLTIHGKAKSQVICKAVPWWPYEHVPEFVTMDANFKADLMTQSMKRHERASLLGLLKAKPEDLKSMHALRVHVSEGIIGSRGQGGRSDLSNARSRASYIDLIVRTAVPIYKKTPKRILVFTFKDSGSINYREEIRAAFIKAGIAAEAIHFGSKGIKPEHRVIIETWGLHVSTNAFVSCSAVFFLGILRYAPEDMQLASWGCHQDEELPLSSLPWSVAELDRSMIVCNVAQAVLRAAARATVEGMCQECDAYMILKDPGNNWPAMEREMRKILGNFTLLPWEKATTRKQRVSQLDQLIEQEVLARAAAEGCGLITFASVKRAVIGRVGNEIAPNTWSKYRQSADTRLAVQGITVNGDGRAAKGWVKSP